MADEPEYKPTVAEASRIYFLPNLFTAGNLFFGFVAIIRCIQAKQNELIGEPYTDLYVQAVWCILGAFICDALDGRVARLGGRESLFGKEFDSIVDMVSFGVAPALMVFFLILSPTEDYEFFRNVGWLVGFVYLLCAGVRLSRFNVITSPLLTPPSELKKSSSDFVGLPVPAAAGFIASLVLVFIKFDLGEWSIVLPIMIFALMLLIAWLMVSTLPYPSFKTLDWHTHTNVTVFIGFVIAIIVAFFLLEEFAFSVLFLLYIFAGPIRGLYLGLKRKRNS